MDPIKRAAGVYARETAAARCFLDRVRAECDAATMRRLHTLVYPARAPKVAAVVRENGQPPVQWAGRGDGSFAILDGEIYNAAQLCDLPDRPPGNDADILLDLYFSDGEEALVRVDGAMGLVIWDATREVLLLYRDRSGIVPIFYSEQPDGLVWASDIPTLLRTSTVARNVNLPALDFFLGNSFVPAPWTCVEGVNKVPPAHVLMVPRSGTATLRRYWQARGRPKLKLQAEEVNEHLGGLLKQALSRRWSTDARTGVLLSGGVDSRLIVAGLKSLLGVSPETFTFHYTDYEGQYNEIQEARRTADYFGVRHHEITYRPADITDNLESMVQSYGEPFTYGLHSFLLRDVTKAGVSALLSGASVGYLYLTELDVHGLRYARLPSMVQKAGRASTRLLRKLNCAARPLWLWRAYAAAGSMADMAEPVIWCASTGFPSTLRGELLPDEWRGALYSNASWVPQARRATGDLFRAAMNDYDGESARDKITFLDFEFRSAECTLQWNHWWGRALGLAIRFPYCDADLLDFAFRLPRKGLDKDEIRRLAESLMPREMAYAPKIFQTVPINHWFRGPLKDFLRDQLTPGRLKDSGIFDVGAVQNCMKQYLRGKNNKAWLLWAIITVLIWKDLLGRRAL